MAQPIWQPGTDNIIDELAGLLAVEHDAIRAYDGAIHRLHDPSCRKRFERFRVSHRRQARALASLFRERGGGSLSGAGKGGSSLPQGSAVIDNLVDDQDLLRAMHGNERQINKAYREALERLGEEPRVGDVLRRNLRDEQKHHRWLEETLKAT